MTSQIVVPDCSGAHIPSWGFQTISKTALTSFHQPGWASVAHGPVLIHFLEIAPCKPLISRLWLVLTQPSIS